MNEEMNTNMAEAATIETAATTIENNEVETVEVAQDEAEQATMPEQTAIAEEPATPETQTVDNSEPAMPAKGIDFATAGKAAAGVMIGVGGFYLAKEKVIPAGKAIIADAKEKINAAREKAYEKKQAKAAAKARKLRNKAAALEEAAEKLAPTIKPAQPEQTTE